MILILRERNQIMKFKAMADRPAKILEVPAVANNYNWVVELADGNLERLAGLGTPKPDRDKVGDQGSLTYMSTPSRGWWAWTPKD